MPIRPATTSALTLLALTAHAFAAVAPPPTVSPGSLNALVVVSGPCPGFSWGAVAGANSYELAVYEFDARGVVEGEPTLFLSLPGSATAWTPSLDHCPRPGGSYAWAVRAIFGDSASEWSESRLFRLSDAPSVAEVEDALEVLRRFAHLSTDTHQAIPGVDREDDTGSAEALERNPSETGSPIRAFGSERTSRRLQRLELLRSSTLGAESTSPRTLIFPTKYPLALEGDLVLDGNVFKEGRALLHTDGGFAAGNTALGFGALVNATPGMPDNGDGEFNTAVGSRALSVNREGHANTAVGTLALTANSDGNYNTATGTEALFQNSSGSRNTATGAFSMVVNTTGNSNTASGFRALSYNTTGFGNTASGAYALANNGASGNNTATGFATLQYNDGFDNTATGAKALHYNTAGYDNTATGAFALLANTSGAKNTATGEFALRDNTTGSSNTATGEQTLADNTTGGSNTAVGQAALAKNTTGSRNVALGENALFDSSQGDDNIAVGRFAGVLLASGDNNIYIGNPGEESESDTIRIGETDSHTAAFVAGVRGTNVGSGIQVLVGGLGRLGTTTSSRRFKEGIADMADASAALLALRPVTFRYSEDAAGGGPRPVDFGLIAEEVAEIYPALVAWDEEGRPYSVRYHVLPAMLLNEIQRQERELRQLRERLRSLEGTSVRGGLR